MNRAPRRGRNTDSSDDAVIHIGAGLLLAVVAVAGYYKYSDAKAADLQVRVIEQERQQNVAEAEEARRVEQRNLAQADAERWARAQANSQPVMYKCRDGAGDVAIQSWPCANGTATEWTRGYEARGERAAAEAAQRAGETARHEAEVAQYTQMYGDLPAPVRNSAGAQPDAAASRCAAAKAYRDDVYRQVGNNRTFDLIRQLDDYVYEACKQT